MGRIPSSYNPFVLCLIIIHFDSLCPVLFGGSDAVLFLDFPEKMTILVMCLLSVLMANKTADVSTLLKVAACSEVLETS